MAKINPFNSDETSATQDDQTKVNGTEPPSGRGRDVGVTEGMRGDSAVAEPNLPLDQVKEFFSVHARSISIVTVIAIVWAVSQEYFNITSDLSQAKGSIQVHSDKLDQNSNILQGLKEKALVNDETVSQVKESVARAEDSIKHVDAEVGRVKNKLHEVEKEVARQGEHFAINGDSK